MRAYEMVIYRDMNQDEIFSNLCQVIDGYKKMEKAEVRKRIFQGISGLIEAGQSSGFGGNRWQMMRIRIAVSVKRRVPWKEA